MCLRGGVLRALMADYLRAYVPVSEGTYVFRGGVPACLSGWLCTAWQRGGILAVCVRACVAAHCVSACVRICVAEYQRTYLRRCVPACLCACVETYSVP